MLVEALERFHDILTYNNNDLPYTTEATIQIFEYCFELFCKLLKKICADIRSKGKLPKSRATASLCHSAY